jgi:hypothetical protein
MLAHYFPQKFQRGFLIATLGNEAFQKLALVVDLLPCNFLATREIYSNHTGQFIQLKPAEQNRQTHR